MTVFSTLLKILNKLKGMLILYTVILISVTFLNQTSSNSTINYEEVKPDILIVNKDSDNFVTKNFLSYIKKHSNVKNIDDYDLENIDDAIFYKDINFVIYIPNGFGDLLLRGDIPVVKYKSGDDFYASYSKMLVEKYIKTVYLYKDVSNKDRDKFLGYVNDTLASDVSVKLSSKFDSSRFSDMTRYFNFLNYAFLAGCVYSISMILSSIKNENIKKRTVISSFNYKKYNRIVLFVNFLVVFLMWILYILLSFILFKDLLLSMHGVLYIINSFIFAICCLSMGFLIGNITQNKKAIGGIINVVALGSSFLCGCFVPFQYMPSYVLKLAHVLPTYYFVSNNEAIKVLEVFNFESIKPLIINAIVIISFSLVFIILVNYISRRKQRID